MILLYIAVFLLVAFIIFFLIFGYCVFRRVCLRKPARPDTFEATFSKSKLAVADNERLASDYEWFMNSKSSELCVVSKDRKKLYASAVFSSSDQPKGVIILFHGYRSSCVRDFCLQMRILHNAGYHLLVVDQHSHGRSEGKYICYGVREREDVLLWSKAARSFFGDSLPLCLMGLSMGAATVIMSSALVDNNDTSIKCVVADCPFSMPWDIVSHVLVRDHHLPKYPLMYFVNFWCRLLAHFSLKTISSEKAAASTHLPILVFHGEADDFVPTRFSLDIKNAANDKVRLVTVPNAAHGESIYLDEALYTDELFSFLDKNMKA